MEIRPHPKHRHRSVVRFDNVNEYYWYRTAKSPGITMGFSHMIFFLETITGKPKDDWSVEHSVGNRKLYKIGYWLGSQAVAGVLHDIDQDNPEFMTPAKDALKARMALTVHEYFEPMLNMAASRTESPPVE